MSRVAEPRLSFRSLHESPLVQVREYDCVACGSAAGPEEASDDDSIVLLRRGAFRKHFGRRSITADVNQAVFFSRGSSYGVSHPGGCGDAGTTLRTTPRVLRDILRELDPASDDRRGATFPFVTGPCDASLHAAHRRLVLRLRCSDAEASEPAWVEAEVLQLMADALAAAHARHGLLRDGGPRRDGTSADHADTAEAAMAYLASRYAERVTLASVAAAVHASPFHLARIFRRHAGVPLHRYLLRLRLRTAVERLADMRDDDGLSELAHALGFASHAHFTDAFRKEMGCAPSQYRRDARAGLRRR